MKKRTHTRYTSRKRKKKQRTVPIRLRWVLLALGVFIGFVFFQGPTSVIELYKREVEKREKMQKKQAMERQLQELELERERLESDTSYIIKIAREKYGLKHPDEKVWKIEPK